MITDPVFYLVATLALLIIGIAKGGLAGGIGMVGVPLISLSVAPFRAAAIVLPILMVMDAFALRAYWRRWDPINLAYMIPGAILGTVIGSLTFRYLSAENLRVLIGSIAVIYSLNWLLRRGTTPAKSASLIRGSLWGTLSGFTSFGIHAGGPPVHIYLLSQQMDKTRFQATTVAFFFLVNWFKLGPYIYLGQFDTGNLITSLLLAPLAPIGITLGAYLHKRINPAVFYKVVYVSLLLIGAKLIIDGTGVSLPFIG